MLSQEIFIFRVPIPLFLLNLFGYINLITDPNSSGYRKPTLSYYFFGWCVMKNVSCWFNSLPVFLTVLLFAILLSSCSTLNVVPPEVNLMRVDVREVTLSHVNLLADLRIFNPNDADLIIQGVDYTLKIEGIKLFSGKTRRGQTIAPQEYGQLTLRLSSAYWDIIQLLNTLPNKSDVEFYMQGSILVGKSSLFAHRYSFEKQGVIPFQKTAQ
jgi:LEA14-like dessication related protein